MKVHKLSNSVTKELLDREKHSFVGYLTAGYPDVESFFRIVKRCEDEGLQILEVGFPAADPYADGDIIRHAHSVVDPAIKCDMNFWRRLRQTVSLPIWLMGYRSDLIDSGVYRKLAEEHLIDALVIPDMDNGHHVEIMNEVSSFGVDVLGFISQAAGEAENQVCFDNLGIIYHQLYSGPTGIVNNSEDYLELFTKAKKESNAYLFAGFGIGTPERAQELLRHGFDGVVIGTAIMKRLEQSEEELYDFIRTLRQAVRTAK